MTLVQPIADMGLSFSFNFQTGQTLVDIALTPSNDMAMVTGTRRLQQDVLRWLLCPLGSNPFDVGWGNPLWQEVGRPYTDRDTYVAMVEQCQDDFIARQAIYAQQGWLSLEEQVDHFDGTTIYLPGDSYNGSAVPIGAAIIAFNIVPKSGAPAPVIVPFSS